MAVIYLTYELYQDRAGQWRWRLMTVNNHIIAESAEGYFNKQDCLDAIDMVKGSGYAPVREAKSSGAGPSNSA